MVSQAEFQAAGFPVGGEPLGVDLADTLVTVTQPAADREPSGLELCL